MSKERARRREAREAAAALARDRAEQRRLAEVARSRARADRARARRRLLGPSGRPRSPRLRRAAARRWAPVLALLVVAHALLWLLSDSWALRATALGVTVLAAPLLWVLVSDSGGSGGSVRSRRSGYRRRP